MVAARSQKSLDLDSKPECGNKNGVFEEKAHRGLRSGQDEQASDGSEELLDLQQQEKRNGETTRNAGKTVRLKAP